MMMSSEVYVQLRSSSNSNVLWLSAARIDKEQHEVYRQLQRVLVAEQH